MDYIINPMWIYWANVLGDLKLICCILAVLSGIAAAIAIGVMLCNKQYGENDDDYKTGRACTRIFLPLFIVTSIVAVFAPSTKVLVEMLVAKLATKQNIELTAESLKQIVDYIAETIKSLK